MNEHDQCTPNRYFSANPLSCNWFNIVEPRIIVNLPAVAIYRKTEGIPADSHLENPEDGHRMPFIDHTVAFPFPHVNCQWHQKRVVHLIPIPIHPFIP